MQMLNHASLGSIFATTWVVSYYAHSPCMGIVRKKILSSDFWVIGKPRLLQDVFVPEHLRHDTRNSKVKIVSLFSHREGEAMVHTP